MVTNALRRPETDDPKQSASVHTLFPTATGRLEPRRHVRTLFISDVHLGTRGCKADALLSFLQAHDFDTLYLVGDIVDGWRLKRSWFWRPSHDAVIREVLNRAASGTRVIYIPGNHDESLRPYTGHNLAGVELRSEAIHKTADGRNFLVLHGDCFDAAVRYAPFLAHLGDRAYNVAIYISERLNDLRRLVGLGHWSLATFLKRTVKNAVAFIGRFEDAAARETLARGLDGIICGHIHHATIRQLGRTLYCNDGDWVESCTALAEYPDGRLAILNADGSVLEEERAPAREMAMA